MDVLFVNRPRPLARASYDDALSHVVGNLQRHAGLLAIYQIGGIGHPGISDLDIICVYQDGTRVPENPLEGLGRTGRQIFTHEVVGVSRSQFEVLGRYTLWHNYRLIYGTELDAVVDVDALADQRKPLEVQTAFEFLVKNYMDVVVQRTYRMVKLRALLQQVKGICYDLDFLDVSEGPLYERVYELMEWMDRWFERRPTDRVLGTWLSAFVDALEALLRDRLPETPLYVPTRRTMRIARNVTLAAGPALMSHDAGVVPPFFLLRPASRMLGRRAFNVLHRCNRFAFEVPMTTTPPHQVLEERFRFFARLKAYAATHFAHLGPSLTSLTYHIV